MGQLSLVLWKNFVLKKRGFCGFLIEILFPVIILSFLVLIRSLVDIESVNESIYVEDGITASTGIYSFVNSAGCGGRSRNSGQIVAFAPENPQDINKVYDLRDSVQSSFLANAPPVNFSCFVCSDDECLNLNATPIADYLASSFFVVFNSSKELNDYYQDSHYDDTNGTQTLVLAVTVASTVPNWDYRIRANISDIPYTGVVVDNLVVGYDQKNWQQYFTSGILTLQLYIDQFILANTTGTLTPKDASFVPFPTATYQQDNFQAYVGDVFGLFLVFAFIWPFSRLVRNLVEEKEKKIKEGMKMMGLQNWIFWASWSVTYILIFIISILLFLAIAKASLFKYSSFGVLFVFFFGFALSMVTAGCLLMSFFTRAKTAGPLSPFVLMVGYLPFFAVSDATYSTTAKNAASLLSPVALSLGGSNVLAWESAFQGARWSNINEVVDNYTLATAIVFLYVDTLIYGLLAWYLDQVWPSEYGTQLPWYFPFTLSYWQSVFPCCQCRRQSTEKVPLLGVTAAGDDVVDYGPNHEPVSRQMEDLLGLRIRNLRKQFPGEEDIPFTAVHNLNLDIYKGQIFVLLGHNGAGKTTTLNMLTGMLPPTSGGADVFGYQIAKDMDRIRGMMGVCPQHDTLFDTLTVQEHLEFFGSLKGVDKSRISGEVKQAISNVGLEEKTHHQARTLSGGQKRRLSLAIALIGDSRIVFLDEPTSGVDPHSRRHIWNLLSKQKQDRVIILTTHFMDEADQLGDRIGILHKGRMQCCGSSLFLKRKYGIGYVLTITKRHESESQVVTQTIKHFVFAAEKLSDVGQEVVYRLPLSASSEFPKLLDELDSKKRELGIVAYGLSVTTLEEVFLKVAQDVSTTVEEKKDTSELIRSLSDRRVSVSRSPSVIDEHLQANASEQTFTRHLKALLYKRWHTSKRDRKALCCQVLLPLVLLAAGLGLLHIPPNTTFPTVELSPTEFNQPLPIPESGLNPLLMNSIQNNSATAYNLFFLDSNATNLTDFSYFILNTTHDYKASRYGAFFQDPTLQPADPDYTYTAFNNMSAPHGLPTWMNMINSALLRTLSGVNGSQILTKIQPFDPTWRQKEFIQGVNGIFAAIVISMGFVFIPASFGTVIVKEKETKARHLQSISGVSSIAYWTSNYIWDFISFLVPAIAGALIVLAYNYPNFVGDNFPVLILCFLLYGLSVIPFTYILTFLFRSHSTAQNVMVIIYLFAGIGMTLANFILNLLPSTHDANQQYIRHLFRLIPNFCLGDSVFYMGISSAFISSSNWDLDVTGYDMIFMSCEAVGYFLITLLIDKLSTVPSFVGFFVGDPQGADEDIKQLDEDVAAEEERVKSGKADEEPIRVRGLRKVFRPSKVAARDVWFAIPDGQCFGFLGVNGAGKTTVLRMLTGDEIPTRGTASLGGLDILNHPEQVRRLMGYCPQFDAIFELLTAKETLEFYGRVRGIPESKLPIMVSRLIERLSLTDYKDRAAGKYSGGNKRKLSVAIALIGNPKVVFLDEPSTGMDPVSRRFMWDFISETMHGRAVILTTHSMEECEALCDRIGIFSNGQLRCIGTSQHLKTRFGTGLQIDISTADKDPEKAKNFIISQFPHAEEIESFGSNLKYKIEAKMRLSEIFSLIEQHKEEANISDYSVGQTTLEQIFINFAKQGQSQQRSSSWVGELNEQISGAAHYSGGAATLVEGEEGGGDGEKKGGGGDDDDSGYRSELLERSSSSSSKKKRPIELGSSQR